MPFDFILEHASFAFVVGLHQMPKRTAANSSITAFAIISSHPVFDLAFAAQPIYLDQAHLPDYFSFEPVFDLGSKTF